MPLLDGWEPWMQKIVREMIGRLNSWNSDIDNTPLESRRDNVIGLIWHGRATRFNILTFRHKKDGLEMGLLLRHSLADQFKPEIRNAGLKADYSESQGGRLLILLTSQTDFGNNKTRLQELLHTTYEQSVKPHLRGK